MPVSLAAFSGIGWITSQCSTTLPFSSLKMSTMALARVPGSRTAWTCRDDVVAVGEDLLDLAARIREFLAHEIDELMESLRTVGGVGIVLGITWAEILRGFGEVLLIDAHLVELEHRGFLP